MAIERPELETPTLAETVVSPVGEVDGEELLLTQEPLWKVRLRLLRKSTRRNWDLFKENKVGLLGLAIILLFALAALAHPVLMRTVWAGESDIYDPIIGYDAVLQERVIVGSVAEITDPNTQIDLGRARVFDLTLTVGDSVEFPLQPAPGNAGVSSLTSHASSLDFGFLADVAARRSS